MPGSASRHRSGSTDPTDIATPTGARSAASRSSGRSRRISEPFVRTENGLAASRSAARIPGISRYRPSARW